MNKESFQPPHLAPEAPQPSPRGKMGPAITWSLSVVGLGGASGVPAPQGSVVHPEAEEQRVQQIWGVPGGGSPSLVAVSHGGLGAQEPTGLMASLLGPAHHGGDCPQTACVCPFLPKLHHARSFNSYLDKVMAGPSLQCQNFAEQEKFGLQREQGETACLYGSTLSLPQPQC